MTLNLTQKEIDAWQQFIYETTPGVVKPTKEAAQPTVINHYYFVDASINIQAIVNPGNASARIVDNRSRLADDVRRYLPSNYQPTNDMDEVAQKLLTPMTKEEKAGLGPWQCF